MTAAPGKSISHLRWGATALLALIFLSWCSYLWNGLLRRNEIQLPIQAWWQQAHDNSSSHYTVVASTGPRVQYHEWNITRVDIAPDGLTRPMILVNNRFPGPPVHVNVGDTLVIKVNNLLNTNESSSFAHWDTTARNRFSSRVDDYYPSGTDERVAIHWHGLSMRRSPDQDGAPGFTSCAALPGESHTYRFQIQQEDVGTHWWHSHTGMSRSDGLWGTLIVNDPAGQSEEKLLKAHAVAEGQKTLEWDHEQVVTLGDHYFAPGIDQISWFISRHSLGFEPTPDNILINGQGTFNCSRLLNPAQYGDCSSTTASYPTIELEHGKTHRLRLINVGSVGHQTFSIDDHELTVIEADGSIIVPYKTTRLSIAPGQRYSVLVSADRGSQASTFWSRTEMDHECFNMPNPNLAGYARAIVQYNTRGQSSARVEHDAFDLELRTKGSRRNMLAPIVGSVLPSTQPWPHNQGQQPCHDEDAALLRPLRVKAQGALPAPRLNLGAGDSREVITVTMPKLDRNGLVPISLINRTQWMSPSIPLLRSFARNATTHADPHLQTVLTPSRSSPTTIELIINNSDEAPHPFHLHGHRFYVMGLSESSVGFGAYKPDGENIDARWYDEDSAPYRDTVSVPRRGFAVIRWRTDNPGVWALHCHVLVHMQTGMALAVVDQANQIGQLDFVKGLGDDFSCPKHIAAAP